MIQTINNDIKTPTTEINDDIIDYLRELDYEEKIETSFEEYMEYIDTSIGDISQLL